MTYSSVRYDGIAHGLMVTWEEVAPDTYDAYFGDRKVAELFKGISRWFVKTDRGKEAIPFVHKSTALKVIVNSVHKGYI